MKLVQYLQCGHSQYYCIVAYIAAGNKNGQDFFVIVK